MLSPLYTEMDIAFDTASAYKNRRIVGIVAIAKCVSQEKDLFITTKIWNNAQVWDVEVKLQRSWILPDLIIPICV